MIFGLIMIFFSNKYSTFAVELKKISRNLMIFPVLGGGINKLSMETKKCMNNKSMKI